jgi:hypothetical protein
LRVAGLVALVAQAAAAPPPSPAAAPAAPAAAAAPTAPALPDPAAAPPPGAPVDLVPLPERPIHESAPFGEPLSPAERDQLPGMEQLEFREMAEPDSVSRPLGAAGSQSGPPGEPLDPHDDRAAEGPAPFSGLMGAGVLMVSAGAALLVLALLIWIFSGSPKRIPVQAARRA